MERLKNPRSLDTARPRRAQSDDITTKISRYNETTETVFNGDVRGYVRTVMKAEIVIAHAQFNLSPGPNHPHPPLASGTVSSHETGPSPQIALRTLAPLITDSLRADNGLSDSPVMTPDQELEREAEGKRLLDTGLSWIQEGNRLVEKGTRRVERAQRLLESAPDRDRRT